MGSFTVIHRSTQIRSESDYLTFDLLTILYFHHENQCMLRSCFRLPACTFRPILKTPSNVRSFTARSCIMSSQAPDASTTVTKSVAESAAAGGSEPGQFKDEVTGEMVSKRCRLHLGSSMHSNSLTPNCRQRAQAPSEAAREGRKEG